MKTQKYPKPNADGLLEGILARVIGEPIYSLEIAGVIINDAPLGGLKIMSSDRGPVVWWELENRRGILCSLPSVFPDAHIVVNIVNTEIVSVSWNSIKITFNKLD